MWPTILIAALLAALAALHFFWRWKFSRAQKELRDTAASFELEKLQFEWQSQLRQQTVFDSMTEGLLLLDCDGRIELANRALFELFALSGDVRGKTLIETLRAHELAELVRNLGIHGRVSSEIKFSDDRWFAVNAAAIRDENGKRERSILIFHELTRLKKLERTREEFVANVSHELRTPLSLIKGYVETLLGGAKDDPDVATKFLQTIERHSERLSLLIEDLLAISELESGRIVLHLQTVSLRQAVEKVFEDFSARAAAKNVALANEMPELEAEADSQRIQQVISNLVDNAIKYGGAGGCVVVGGRAAGDGKIEVRVEDCGPGIPRESLERVFERFYRVDKARSREQGGTGLGLSIVKHIVQSHGGRVWAESEPGKGATFFFTVPEEKRAELL